MVKQWKEKLAGAFSIRIGEYTGVKKDLQSITISTYESAFINAEYLGNKFKLLIFDEVHHLPSEGFRQIAELFASPSRLGLTATYERADGLHKELPRLMGGIVFEIKPDELTEKYLAKYEIIKINVELTEEEKKDYEKSYKIFKNYLISRNIKMKSSGDFKKIIIRSGYDPKARKAILSRNKAERIAYNSKNKIEQIKEFLNKDNRIIIFTRYNDMVYNISKKYLIPCITYRTNNKEREEILTKLKKGNILP